MSGAPLTGVLDREAVVAAAGELATVLRVEITHLERDARALELRGNRLFAGQVRDMRARFARVLRLAEAVVREGQL